MTRTSPESQKHVTNAQPAVHHALIGAAFGVLLIYLGTLVSFRTLRWPIVGAGALFVVADDMHYWYCDTTT